MIPLFPFQQEAVDAVFRDWAAGQHAVVVSLPTGAGKTLVAATIAHRAYQVCPEPILVLVPSDEILRQTVEEMAVVWEGGPIGIIQQQTRQWQCPLLVASVATLVRHLDDLPPIGLVITDEAHHADAPMWQGIYQAIARRAPYARHVGLTATPFRADRGGEAHAIAMFPTLSYARSMFDLIADGFLVPLRGIGIHSATALDGVAVQGDDYEEQALARVVNTPARNTLIVQSYRQHCASKRALCFAVNRQHAATLTTAFTEAGVTAVLLTGETSRDQRRHLLTELRAGTVQLIVTCGVLREGFNEPSVEAVLCARPTRSRVLYIQQIGRVSRLWPGKTEGLILDVVDNTTAHRPVSLSELLAFYGLRRAEVALATRTPRRGGRAQDQEVQLTPRTIAEIRALAPLTPLVREVNLFHLDAFAWYTAHNGRSFAVSLGEGISLGVLACMNDDEQYEVMVVFTQDATFARLLPHPTRLETAMLCANAYLFDFGDWRFATRHARWRAAEPTASQWRHLRAARVHDTQGSTEIVGPLDEVRTRGQASGAISALQVWQLVRSGDAIDRQTAQERLRQRARTATGSCPPLVVTGTCDAPVVGVLHRYQRSLHDTRANTFTAFLRDTLPRCHFAVTADQVIVTGNATTAAYTAGQWRAIGTALSEALSVLGPITVVIGPPLQTDDPPRSPPTTVTTTSVSAQEGAQS